MDGKMGFWEECQINLNETLFIESEELIIPLIINSKLSQVDVATENAVVFKIYQRFAFMNEDIIRTQVENELSQFASKENGILSHALPYQAKAQNT